MTEDAMDGTAVTDPLLEGAQCFREAVVRSCDEMLVRQKHEIRQRDAMIAVLRAALKPFSDHVDEGYFAAGNGDHWITVADCKRARAVLAAVA